MALEGSTDDNAYEISDDATKLDLDVVYAFLSNSYWAKGMPRAVFDRAIVHSLCFGVYHQGAQVGFARVVTDKATFAYLADVFVLEAHRGKGLSKRLVAFICEHPDLQGLRRFMLATKEAHGLYARFGFAPSKFPDRLMEILNLHVYETPPASRL